MQSSVIVHDYGALRFQFAMSERKGLSDTELAFSSVVEQGRLIASGKLSNVALRLSALLNALESIESELGPVMDRTEPVPPVYPREPGQ